MKAVILAGGMGTRLRPLTNDIPKPMVPINGKPLLYYHIQQLLYYGITDIWILTQYLPEKIEDYFKDGSAFGVNIKYSREIEPLGTSGALKNPDSTIYEDLKTDSFLVVYGDNLTNFDYGKIIAFHREKSAKMTIGLYHSDVPWTKGVIFLDDDKRITKMVEKPPKEEHMTDTVNSGIYVCEKDVLDYIPDGFSDFGFDVIPQLIAKGLPVYGFDNGYIVQDIGTFEGLAEAEKLIKTNAFSSIP
jgi:mannose-1-phosphate guanylyltransferase